VISVLKYAPWAAAGLAVIAASIFYAFMLAARGQRDAARAEVKVQVAKLGAEIQSRVLAEANAKVAADAADRIGREVREQTARCDQSIAELRARADSYRAILRRCPSGEALAKRMGSVFP